jgi:ectoine hydroxylase-related dioxygenase (phytanoyl-CoA dioxygenase family)
MLITAEHIKQFHEEGYFVLERVISEEDLHGLRLECQKYIDMKNTEMDERDTDTLGISHRNNRYFIDNRFQSSQFLKQFLFSDRMMEITRSILGDEVYLFIELFVVKYPQVGMSFGWHQDSGYMQGNPHKPYMSCWCALDDMSEENGTLYVLPFSRVGNRQVIEHHRDEATNDLLGYFGDDPGIPMIVPASSIVVFSSLLLHRTGPNQTGTMRRAYLAEYSAEPIIDREGKIWSLAVPFLKSGERVVEERDFASVLNAK